MGKTRNKKGYIKDNNFSSSSGQKKPLWQIRTLDLDGPWGRNKLDAEALKDIYEKLANFETMTWDEIIKTGSHPVKIENICSKAQKRLAEIIIKIDTEEELFSLRISATKRLWGIREHNILKLLWWDPLHEVYPVSKKHT